MAKDMTIGSPAKQILFFSIPQLIGNLFQQFYNMADTFIVGRTLGSNALAAVGCTGGLTFLLQGFATGPLLRVLRTPAEIFNDAYSYFIFIVGGLASCILFNLMSNAMRSVGDSIKSTSLSGHRLCAKYHSGLDFHPAPGYGGRRRSHRHPCGAVPFRLSLHFLYQMERTRSANWSEAFQIHSGRLEAAFQAGAAHGVPKLYHYSGNYRCTICPEHPGYHRDRRIYGCIQTG